MNHKSVAQLVADYASAFTGCDAARVAEFYALPATIVGPAGSAVFSDRMSLVDNMRQLIDRYVALGFRRAEALDVGIETVSDEIGQADIRWRLHTDGSPIDFSTRYWLVDRDDQAAIAAVLAHSESEVTTRR